MKWYLPVCIGTFALGLLTWAYFADVLIINWSRPMIVQETATSTPAKKNVRLFFWQHGRWQHDDAELLWTDNADTNVTHLLNCWLTLLEEEEVTDKHVTVQTALHASDGTDLYVSFDRHPLSKQWSTHAKWLWVEGLLKTIRENDCTPQHLTFLVQHQPMQDPHLDFSIRWPIASFASPQH